MFQKPITSATASRILEAVTAIASSGDPATAEDMRRWFNRSFKGFAIDQILDGGLVAGYRLTSSIYGAELKETKVRLAADEPAKPVARKKAAPPARKKAGPAGSPMQPRQPREGWYAKLDAVLPPVIDTTGSAGGAA